MGPARDDDTKAMGPSSRRVRNMHGRRSPAGAERRKSKWLANGGLDKAERALALNTSMCLTDFFGICLTNFHFSSHNYSKVLGVPRPVSWGPN